MKEQTTKELANLIAELNNLITEMLRFLPPRTANEFIKKLIKIKENK
jgi:hypothetical protein